MDTDHDRAMEMLVGRLLQIGVFVAAAVVIAGGATLLAHHGRDVETFTEFRGAGGPLNSVHGILRGARTLDARALVQLGLVLLIATPVARVALTLVAFVKQRDRLYVAITAVVLGLLLYGLL